MIFRFQSLYSSITDIDLCRCDVKLIALITPKEQKMSKQSDLDNHSNQLNPNNNEYWHSRDCTSHVD